MDSNIGDQASDNITDSDNDAYQAKSSLQTARSRGRPRLSKLSQPIMSFDLEVGKYEVTYLNEDDPNNPKNCIQDCDDPTIGKVEDFLATFKLENSAEENTKTMLAAEHLAEVDGKIEVKGDEPFKFQAQELKNTGTFYVNPIFAELMNSGLTMVPKTNKKIVRTGAQKRASDKLEGVRLVVAEGLSITKAAETVRLPYTVLWRAYAEYKLGPHNFCKKIKKQLEANDSVQLPTKEEFLNVFRASIPLLATTKDMLGFLRKNCMIDEDIKDKVLFEAARNKYNLVKRIPKQEKSVTDTKYRGMGISTFNLLLDKYFLSHSFLTIFDVATFKLETGNLKAWTLRGVQPKKVIKSSYDYIHALVAISFKGIDMIVCKRKPVMAEDINVFFRLYLETHGRKSMILLDNAAVHRRQDLELIGRQYGATFAYNVAKNPARNPIEWVFGAVKGKFRAICAQSDRFSASDAIRCFAEVHNTCYHSTVYRCLNSFE